MPVPKLRSPSCIVTSPSLILYSWPWCYRFVAIHARRFPLPILSSTTTLSIDLQPFRAELEELYLTDGYTHQQLVYWLADRGLVVAPRTLKKRFKDWGITRRATITPGALETISHLFHTITDDDDAITRTLTAQGTAVSTRQV